MNCAKCSDKEQAAGRTANLFSKFKANRDGTTAIEFAMVGIPFLMMLFGIIIIGLFFFTTFALENAVERAGRLIRTGQVQAADMTEAQFKTEVCSRAPVFVDCDDNIKVLVQSFADDTANIAPLSCLNEGGNDLGSTGSFDTGGANSIVLVTVCYKWELTSVMPTFDFFGNGPVFDLGNMGDSGNRLIQASTTFRTEPYEES